MKPSKKIAGKTIPDIFQMTGKFISASWKLKQSGRRLKGEKQVIACGGGAVLNTINIDRLRVTGVIINLIAKPKIILKRTARENGSRPLLNVEQPLERIKELKKFRKPFYDRAADITINTSKLSIDITADKIIDRLKKYEGFNL